MPAGLLHKGVGRSAKFSLVNPHLPGISAALGGIGDAGVLVESDGNGSAHGYGLKRPILAGTPDSGVYR